MDAKLANYIRKIGEKKRNRSAEDCVTCVPFIDTALILLRNAFQTPDKTPPSVPLPSELASHGHRTGAIKQRLHHPVQFQALFSEL